MNYSLFTKLNDIDEKLIASFFESYLIEPEYFRCRRDNLISLKEYLLELKHKKMLFDQQVDSIISPIKEKNKDIIFIEPYFDTIINDLVVCEGGKLIVSPSDLKEKLSPVLDIISKNDYTDERNGFISVSNNFIINPVCFSIVQVLMKDKTPLAELQLQNSDYEVKKFNDKYIKRYTRNNVKRIYFDR